MLANKNWFDDSRYPVGSLMGVDTISLKAQNCGGLVDLKGNRISVVYTPPANAQPYGVNGYRIPTSSPGVAINIEFPDGQAQGGGILIGTSQGIVSAGGLLTVNGSRIPPVTVKLSLTKTGPFTKGNDSAIKVEGGLGSFRYFSANLALVSSSEDQLLFPTKYSSGVEGDYLGHATAPVCHVNKLGDVSLAIGPKIISLPSVSTGDFSGVGAIEKGAKSQQFTFICTGTADTKPTVYFDAAFPFNNGVDGVGMPSADSDIGVQILLNNSPVRFGQNSPVLGWNLVPLNSGVTDVFYGFLTPQGSYCLADCGGDMSGANWVQGGAGSGNNDGFDASVTFKYYQTKTQAPIPSSFSVPFTITIEIQ